MADTATYIAVMEENKSINLSRRAFLGASAITLIPQWAVGKAAAADIPTFQILVGAPSSNSALLNIIATQSASLFVEYGTSKTVFSKKSLEKTLISNQPQEVFISGLKPNSKIYYRIAYKDSTGYVRTTVSSFNTQRKVSSTFAFTVQGDTHPERAGKMFNSDLYNVTLSNIASQNPDFHILLGDDFSIDPIIGKGQANQANIEKIYKTHRDWLAKIGGNTPIYLVNGNHEQAAQYLLDGTETNPAVLAGNARLKYFPLPQPDNFYTGDISEIPFVGKARDYYAWTWGDALFVTLDPYWHSKNAVDNVAGVSNEQDQTNKKNGGAGSKNKDLWQVGIGDEQYAWLKKTLEGSTAKYKFVFAHHVMGTGRGAVEVSYNYEWGGKDPSGKTTFAQERPNWSLPIHDLMVKNKVSIFFQGHDHIFVTQERDGLIYQSMPNPADDTFSMFNETAYLTGTKAPNSGHVRVTVSPSGAKVEYFLAARTSDTSRKNLALAHSYTVKPK